MLSNGSIMFMKSRLFSKRGRAGREGKNRKMIANSENIMGRYEKVHGNPINRFWLQMGVSKYGCNSPIATVWDVFLKGWRSDHPWLFFEDRPLWIEKEIHYLVSP